MFTHEEQNIKVKYCYLKLNSALSQLYPVTAWLRAIIQMNKRRCAKPTYIYLSTDSGCTYPNGALHPCRNYYYRNIHINRSYTN